MVAVTGTDFAVVAWVASQSRVCDVVTANYSVRYQRINTHASCSHMIVYNSDVNITLRNLVSNAEYNVSVVAINSNGDMSEFSDNLNFKTAGVPPHMNGE